MMPHDEPSSGPTNVCLNVVSARDFKIVDVWHGRLPRIGRTIREDVNIVTVAACLNKIADGREHRFLCIGCVENVIQTKPIQLSVGRKSSKSRVTNVWILLGPCTTTS